MGLHVLGVVVALLLVLQPAARTQVAADPRQVDAPADPAAPPAAPLPEVRVDAPLSRTALADDARRGLHRRHGGHLAGHQGHRAHEGHGGRHRRKEVPDGVLDRQDNERKKKRQHRHGGGGEGGGGVQRAEGRHRHQGGKKKNAKNDKKNSKNKTLPFPDDQQIRHRKQRQSRRKGGGGGGGGGRRRKNETLAGPGAAPGAGSHSSNASNASTAFRRRSEEKQQLVGRRTLEVLSPRAPPTSPALVGILDIPVQESTPAPAPAATAAVAVVPVAAGFKLAAKPAGGAGAGRRRGASAASPEQRKPIDPEWLQRLLAAAALTSAKAPSASPDESPCDRWVSCSAKLLPAIRAQLAALPACPCTFPANVFYYNKIWDRKHARYFRWRDASGRAERLDVYHPDASYCIRSLHTAATGMLAAQHCCYDRNRVLVTRGSGAGTPALVSPDVSAALHDILDVRPWRVCKGDFTRYNALRPPNNDNKCTANPDEAEFQRQAELSQFY